MNIDLNKKEIDILIKLLDEKLDNIGILGDAGDRFEYGVLRERLNRIGESNE